MNWKLWSEIALVSLVTTAIIFRVSAVRSIVVGS